MEKSKENSRSKATDLGVEIHAMPERFLASAKHPAPKKARRGKAYILPIAIFLALAGILTGAVFVLYRSVQQAANENTNVVRNQSQPPARNAANENINVANENSNASGNANVANGNTNQPPINQPQQPRRVGNTADRDLDGLTDAEEALYTTDPANPDTDGDGYLDGNEVFNLFSPTRFTPARIFVEAYVDEYGNRFQGYSILYPAAWIASAIDESEKEVLFTAANGDFVSVGVQANPEGASLADWYLARSPGTTVDQLEMITTNRSGLPGIKSPDRLTAYVAAITPQGSSLIFVISYNAGIKTQVDFLRTFNMMVNSLELRAASTVLEEVMVDAADSGTDEGIDEMPDQSEETAIEEESETSIEPSEEESSEDTAGDAGSINGNQVDEPTS